MLADSDRQDDLRSFAAALVHEVRTPLSSLRLCVEDLAYTEILSDRSRRRLDLALGQIGFLEDLAGLMVALSGGPGTGGGGSADVNAVARDVAGQWGDASGGARVLALCEEGIPRAAIVRGALRCVLANLCRNGLQALRGDGAVWIRTRRASAEQVEVSVQDSGCGVPPDLLDRIWEPFYTTRPEGLGIGMALVRTFVEGAGGQVRAESQVGRGTTVTVGLRALPCDYAQRPGGTG